MGTMYYMLVSSNTVKTVRWKSPLPQMRYFDRITSGELSKSHSAGPWKPLILWLLLCMIWLWLTMTFSLWWLSVLCLYRLHTNIESNKVNIHYMWMAMVDPDESSMTLAHIPPVFHVTIFLLHSQALVLANNVQLHLVFLQIRDTTHYDSTSPCSSLPQSLRLTGCIWSSTRKGRSNNKWIGMKGVFSSFQMHKVRCRREVWSHQSI